MKSGVLPEDRPPVQVRLGQLPACVPALKCACLNRCWYAIHDHIPLAGKVTLTNRAAHPCRVYPGPAQTAPCSSSTWMAMSSAPPPAAGGVAESRAATARTAAAVAMAGQLRAAPRTATQPRRRWRCVRCSGCWSATRTCNLLRCSLPTGVLRLVG